MVMSASRRANILRGAYCAPGIDRAAGPVLKGWVRGRAGKFSGSGRAIGPGRPASWAATDERRGPTSSICTTGGNPPFSRIGLSTVPCRAVPSQGQGVEIAAKNRVSRQIGGLTTPGRIEGTGGVGSSGEAGEGGFAPLALAARPDHPPRAHQSGPQATFRPWRLKQRSLTGVARRSIDGRGVGGDPRGARHWLTGGTGSGGVSGQGASASRESGGNAKDGTMRRGGAHVN